MPSSAITAPPSSVKKLFETSLSTTTTLDLVSLISAASKRIDIELYNVVPSVDQSQLQLLVSDDNGSSYETSLYSYHATRSDSGSTSYSATAGQGAAAMLLTASDVAWATKNGHVSGVISVFKPMESAYTTVSWNGTFIKTTSGCGMFSGAGVHTAVSQINALRLQFNGGNLASGDVIVREYL